MEPSKAKSEYSAVDTFKSLATPLLLLMLGLLIMMGTSFMVKNSELAVIVTLGAFCVYNFFVALHFTLLKRLKTVWAIQKIWHIAPGFLIGSIPIGAAYTSLYFQNSLPSFKGFSAMSFLFTLATVSWEELWFRGMPLEMASKRYTKIGAAIVFGLVFAGLHVMNPKIDLTQDAFQLFVAGYALSVCYFAFNSIWAPIGMHLANNLIQAFFGMSTEPRTLLFLGPLLLIAIGLTLLTLKRPNSP